MSGGCRLGADECDALFALLDNLSAIAIEAGL